MPQPEAAVPQPEQQQDDDDDDDNDDNHADEESEEEFGDEMDIQELPIGEDEMKQFAEIASASISQQYKTLIDSTKQGTVLGKRKRKPRQYQDYEKID